MSNSAKIGDMPPRAARAAIPVDQCGMARAVDIVGDRWTLLILRELFYGVRRFADFEADLGIPRAVLSQRLGSMVEVGLLEKAPYQEKGTRTRFEYHLTPMAADLMVMVAAMTEWGDRHLRDDPAPLEFFDKVSRKRVHAGFVTASGAAVPLEQVTARPRKTTPAIKQQD